MDSEEDLENMQMLLGKEQMEDIKMKMKINRLQKYCFAPTDKDMKSMCAAPDMDMNVIDMIIDMANGDDDEEDEEKPEKPENPDNGKPEKPDNEENPEKPDNEEKPEKPDNEENPEKPDNEENPEKPDNEEEFIPQI